MGTMASAPDGRNPACEHLHRLPVPSLPFGGRPGRPAPPLSARETGSRRSRRACPQSAPRSRRSGRCPFAASPPLARTSFASILPYPSLTPTLSGLDLGPRPRASVSRASSSGVYRNSPFNSRQDDPAPWLNPYADEAAT